MAAEEPHPLSGVIGSLNAGLSATEGLRQFREAGGEVRTATWYRLHGEVQAAFGNTLAEAGRPGGRTPTLDETTQWSTVSATGFLQQVEVALRDRSSGEVYFKPYSISGEGLLTRNAAIEQAISSYQEGSDEYDEQVLGAIHVGAYELVPGS